MSAGPLAGIRIMDFGHSWAGPYGGMMLRDLGADVIKIESAEKPEILRVSGSFVDGVRDTERCGWFLTTNRGKKSFGINLKHPGAAELLLRMCDVSDVIIENFAPEVLPSVGLPISRFHERNPKIISISMSGYGNTGPQGDYRSYGDHLLHASGIAGITGNPEDDHTRIGIFYGDPVAGMYAALAIISALRERQTTGVGRNLEMSQVEGLASMIPAAILSTALGKPFVRSADGSTEMHPHGFYRCIGDDTWVAIAVRGDDAWQRFRAMLAGDGIDIAEYPTLAERLENRKAITAAVDSWTSRRSPWQATDRCQAIGVAAFPVLSSQKMLVDDHLNERNFFKIVKRPITGPGVIPGVVFRFNRDGAKVRGYSPLLGEHIDQVASEVIGLSDDEIAAGRAERLLS